MDKKRRNNDKRNLSNPKEGKDIGNENDSDLLFRERQKSKNSQEGKDSGSENDSGLTFHERQKSKNVLHKRAVAQAVLKLGLIRDKDAVILDAGSSTRYLADELFTSNSKLSLHDLSVLTHNLPVFMNVLRKSNSAQHRLYEMLITGGCYDKTYDALYGKITESSYETFYPTVVVLAISGIVSGEATKPGGVFCHAAVETSIKELLFRKRTERRIIIADYTKVGRMDSHCFGYQSELLTGARQVCIVTTKCSNDSNNYIAYKETIDALQNIKNFFVYEVAVDESTKRVVRVTSRNTSESLPEWNIETNNNNKRSRKERSQLS
jgi:DeoR/GlpR family transcriptional regulator of sugar metabolism